MSIKGVILSAIADRLECLTQINFEAGEIEGSLQAALCRSQRAAVMIVGGEVALACVPAGAQLRMVDALRALLSRSGPAPDRAVLARDVEQAITAALFDMCGPEGGVLVAWLSCGRLRCQVADLAGPLHDTLQEGNYD